MQVYLIATGESDDGLIGFLGRGVAMTMNTMVHSYEEKTCRGILSGL
jgi:hypothetical protein